MNDGGAVSGLDGQVIQVGVVVEQDGSYRLGLGIAGLGVGGQYLCAGFELADRDGCAAREQHLRRGREALPAYLRKTDVPA